MLKLLYSTKTEYKILDADDNVVEIYPKHIVKLLLDLGVKINGLKNKPVKEKKYAFVQDSKGIILSPTRIEKAWYLIRHNKAKLLNLEPMKIQLLREQDNTDDSSFKVGIDPGDITGIAVIQECSTKNKVIVKAEIHHRKDIKKRVEQRRNYRRFRRSNKRHRQARFNNRSSSRRKDRVVPSIKSRKDEILRVINYLRKSIYVDEIYCEDVAFDIRVLTDDYKSYGWQYQKSNRLDENIRKAVVLRDKCRCKLCGASGIRLEVHHITPRRENGINTLSNLITLCSDCHSRITGSEDEYKNLLYSLIDGSNPSLKPAMHVMQGKSYLYDRLSKIADLSLTTGGDTSNRRIDWNIPKTHSNDAVCITDSEINYLDTMVYEYKIHPRRRKSKTKQDTSNLSIRHGDIVYYKPRGRNKVKCYVIAILESGISSGKYKLKSFDGEMFGPISVNSIKKLSNNSSLLIS